MWVFIFLIVSNECLFHMRCEDITNKHPTFVVCSFYCRYCPQYLNNFENILTENKYLVQFCGNCGTTLILMLLVGRTSILYCR